jgi:hypothetical protein
MTALFALLVASVALESPAVVNPGFEDIDQQTATPVGWSFTSLPSQPRLVQYETKVDPAGTASRALAISVVPDHPPRTVAYNAHQDLQGIVAGKKYRVTAKVQTRGLRTLPMVVVQCLNDTGDRTLAVARTEERDLQGDVIQWEKVQTEVAVPEGTSKLRLRIGIPSDGNAGGTAMFDDISVVAVE